MSSLTDWILIRLYIPHYYLEPVVIIAFIIKTEPLYHLSMKCWRCNTLVFIKAIFLLFPSWTRSVAVFSPEQILPAVGVCIINNLKRMKISSFFCLFPFPPALPLIYARHECLGASRVWLEFLWTSPRRGATGAESLICAAGLWINSVTAASPDTFRLRKDREAGWREAGGIGRMRWHQREPLSPPPPDKMDSWRIDRQDCALEDNK